MKKLLWFGILFFVSSTAHATFLDFRNLRLIGVDPNGMSSVTFSIGGGLNLTISALDFSGNSQKLTLRNNQGLGIERELVIHNPRSTFDLTDPDEIDYPEVLKLEFSGNVSVLFASLTHFFTDEHLTNAPRFDEMGWWSTHPFNPDTDILGVDFFGFTATDPHPARREPAKGFHLDLGGINTTTLFFSAPGKTILTCGGGSSGCKPKPQHHEFSLGGLGIEFIQVPPTPVPEPDSILLLAGVLLIGLMALKACRLA